jgi:hypothetical protein
MKILRKAIVECICKWNKTTFYFIRLRLFRRKIFLEKSFYTKIFYDENIFRCLVRAWKITNIYIFYIHNIKILIYNNLKNKI